MSILLLSSTDVVVARAFDQQAEAPTWQGAPRRRVREVRRRH